MNVDTEFLTVAYMLLRARSHAIHTLDYESSLEHCDLYLNTPSPEMARLVSELPHTTKNRIGVLSPRWDSSVCSDAPHRVVYHCWKDERRPKELLELRVFRESSDRQTRPFYAAVFKDGQYYDMGRGDYNTTFMWLDGHNPNSCDQVGYFYGRAGEEWNVRIL